MQSVKPQKLRKIKQNILSLLPLLFLCGVPVMCGSEYFDFIVEDYYFYITALGVIGISCFFLMKQTNFLIRLTKIDLLVGLYFIYTIINSIIFRESFHTIKFVSFILFGFVYVLTRIVFTKEFSLKGFINILMIVAYLEVLGGLLQNFDLIPNLQSNMPFGGSFANPGPFSIFIACIVPLVLHSIVNHTNTRLLLGIKYLFIALAVYLIAISTIRSSWIALFVGVGIVLTNKYELLRKIKSLKPVFKTGIAVILIVIIAASGYFMFNLKKDSALGRVFIWKNSIEVIKDYPIIGTGFGNFIYYYNIQQAETVKAGNLTEREFLQADDVKMAYNDMLQITVELGLVGILLFLGTIAYCAIAVLRYKGKNKTDLIAVFAVITAMLAGGLASYPLTILKNQLLFYICIACTASYAKPMYTKQFSLNVKSIQAFRFASIALLVGALIIGVQQQIYIQKWICYKKIFETDNKKLASKELDKLYSKIYGNEQIEYNYTSILIINKNYNKIFLMFNELDKYIIDYEYLLLKADYYMEIRNYIAAEELYSEALKIIPSRFIPRYQLLMCYNSLGHKKEAINMAHEILNTPVKIYGPIIENIQNKAKQYLGIK